MGTVQWMAWITHARGIPWKHIATHACNYELSTGSVVKTDGVLNCTPGTRASNLPNASLRPSPPRGNSLWWQNAVTLHVDQLAPFPTKNACCSWGRPWRCLLWQPRIAQRIWRGPVRWQICGVSPSASECLHVRMLPLSLRSMLDAAEVVREGG